MNARRITQAITRVALIALAAAALPPSARAEHEARNVIVFVGAGLGPAVITAARVGRYKEDGALTMDALPYVARLRTPSLDAQTSDSAAAVSAMLTGVKVRNDVVSMDGGTRSVGFAPGRDPIRNVAGADNRCPANGNGAPSTTLIELAIAKGKATGVVTTSRLTGAGISSAYAHVCHRDAEYEVARQAVPGGVGYNDKLGRGVDVLLGGISTYWRPFEAAKRVRGRPDGRELVGELQARGYTYVTDLVSLNAAPSADGTKIVGLFDFADGDGPWQGEMSHETDRNINREPSLGQMTARALDVLMKNPTGYLLVVDAAGIQTALQGGSARRALADTIALDDAVKVAIDKVDLTNTLVVVAGDHATTLAYIGGGRRGSDVLGLQTDPVTGKPMTDADGNTYTTLVFGTGPNRPDKRANLDAPTVLQRDYLQESAIKLARGTNSATDVVVYATGVGAERFRGSLDHARVFTLIRSAADF